MVRLTLRMFGPGQVFPPEPSALWHPAQLVESSCKPDDWSPIGPPPAKLCLWTVNQPSPQAQTPPPRHWWTLPFLSSPPRLGKILGRRKKLTHLRPSRTTPGVAPLNAPAMPPTSLVPSTSNRPRHTQLQPEPSHRWYKPDPLNTWSDLTCVNGTTPTITTPWPVWAWVLATTPWYLHKRTIMDPILVWSTITWTRMVARTI